MILYMDKHETIEFECKYYIGCYIYKNPLKSVIKNFYTWCENNKCLDVFKKIVNSYIGKM